jgi:hypothetical protein
MAFKTVVTNSLIEQILDSVHSMTTKKGEFTLVMLVPSESGLSDRWNLVVSAKWIDDNGLQAAIPTISSSLREHLSKLNASKVERISVLSTTEPLVADLKPLDIQPGTAYQVQTFALTGRGIEEAIILVAQQPRLSAARKLQTTRTRA